MRRMAMASALGGITEGVGTSWLRVATLERQLTANPPPVLAHLRQLGPKTLARGMAPYTLGTTVGDLWVFTMQHALQGQLHRQPGPVPPVVAAAAGAMAGASEVLLTNPLRALLVAMAAPQYRGQRPAQVASTMLREQGPAAFARGVGPGAMRNAVGCALFFPLVASLRGHERPSAARDLAAGALAGTLVAATVTPLDVLAAAAQSQSGPQMSLLAAAQKLWQQGGIAPFYRGASTTAARAALATGLSFVTTMQAHKALNREG